MLRSLSAARRSVAAVRSASASIRPSQAVRSAAPAVATTALRSFHSVDPTAPPRDEDVPPSSFLQEVDLHNPSAGDRARLSKIIQEVVLTKSNVGDFVPRVVIGNLCAKYRTLNLDGKKHFLLILARELHVDPALVEQSLNYFAENFAHVQHDSMTPGRSEIDWHHEHIERFLRTFRGLRQSLTPMYETFFQQILSQREGGMLFLIHMRADLLQVLRKNAESGAEAAALRSLDASLKSFLASWFEVGFLNLQRVTYEHSPGRLLEKIIRYEAVHPVGTIIELKRRLGRGRRCFAFFHPSVPDEPLVFVHVALVKELANSMPYIKHETEHLEDESHAKAAIFYSISSTQKGLQGIDLGNFLIKEVAKALKREHPQLEIFSTLSPIPNFVPWLKSQRARTDLIPDDDRLRTLRRVLSSRLDSADSLTPVDVVLEAIDIEKWHEEPSLVAALKPVLMRVGAHYVYHEKKRAKALCQVANFHIRNGAIFERLNWLADPSAKGIRQSAGMMVNYKYDLSRVESNNENYLVHNAIAIGKQPLQVLDGEVIAAMVLAQDEIDACREAFLAFDKDRSGTIDVWELRQVLEAMGQQPTEEELFQMISEVDEDMSGAIDFAEFLQVIDNQKDRAALYEDDSDMIDAFVACGGKPDKSGFVRKETLIKIIKQDFGLTINIEEMINKLDVDGSGEIEFDEFKAILT
ncbi:hypothetical protein ATCC90586_000799 [Pythium insidiosum]|nr:hypothetical protein ATCC90586_000799 [Pythium insidiosum]